MSGTELRNVQADRAGRIDVVLAALDPSHSRSYWGRLVREGKVSVDGRVVLRPSQAIAEGAELAVLVPPPPAAGPVPTPMDLTVLHADADIVVIDKPAGLVVHPGVLGEEGTLVHGLLAAFPDMADVAATDADAARPGIVHRLDKGTSGLIVAARSGLARQRLVAAFRDRQVGKTYRAWVMGRPAAEGIWDGSIGRHPTARRRFAVVAGGKPARTLFRRKGAALDVAELEIDLETGRTHQIRVHAMHAGCPLLGDPLYVGRRRPPAEFADWGSQRERPALHAWRLAFAHPVSGAPMQFEAPLPADLADLEARLAALQ
jgi:23S rRNA pseudouridine1911/1915/1917 synthase